MGFRRRLLVLTTVLMTVIACAGLVAAWLFDRALDDAVALEANSGKVLRATRDLQYLLLQQRERYIEMLFLPHGPVRDAIETEFRAGRIDGMKRESELLDATGGDPVLAKRASEIVDALRLVRARIDGLHPPVDPVSLAEFVTAESRVLTDDMERRMNGMIDDVRVRQAERMRTMQESLDNRLVVLALAFVTVVALAGTVLLLFLDRYFAQPMARAIRIASDVAEGGMNQRIPVDSGDEFGVFAQAFNRMLEELTSINQRLESANRDLESFSYTVSHDLRAPLRSISGFALMLQEEAGNRLAPPEQDALQRIRAAAARMSTMIQAMLEIARVDREELRGEWLDLSGIAAEVVEELRAAEAGRAVEVAIEPGVRAWGDAGLMRVVLDNLIGNAWKYTARSAGPRIEFGAHRAEEFCGFFVRDNGAGFDVAFARNLFQPFRRLHTDAEFEGDGIGLATVQRIVLRHGGRISADGVPGAGATFRVVLAPAPAAIPA